MRRHSIENEAGSPVGSAIQKSMSGDSRGPVAWLRQTAIECRAFSCAAPLQPGSISTAG